MVTNVFNLRTFWPLLSLSNVPHHWWQIVFFKDEAPFHIFFSNVTLTFFSLRDGLFAPHPLDTCQLWLPTEVGRRWCASYKAKPHKATNCQLASETLAFGTLSCHRAVWLLWGHSVVRKPRLNGQLTWGGSGPHPSSLSHPSTGKEQAFNSE